MPDFDVRELEYTSFAGQSLYKVTNSLGEILVIPIRAPIRTLGKDAVMRAVRSAIGPHNLAELRMLEQYDAYYRDRHRQLPLPVIYARLTDTVGTRYYIDPRSATVVGQYSARGWVNRWWYNGLHSLDFPWLDHRPLWDIVVIALMLGVPPASPRSS